jgi:hypothetical protein
MRTKAYLVPAIAGALLLSLAAITYAQLANSQCSKETDQQTTSGLSGTLTFPDSCGTQVNSFEMIVAGGPATNNVTINGVMRGGTPVVLGTSTSTANAVIPVNGGPYDKYTVAWTLTGGASPTLTFNRTGAVARHGVIQGVQAAQGNAVVGGPNGAIGDPGVQFATAWKATVDAGQNVGGTCGAFPAMSIGIGKYINAAACNLPATGGTIDARGFLCTSASPCTIDTEALGVPGASAPGTPCQQSKVDGCTLAVFDTMNGHNGRITIYLPCGFINSTGPLPIVRETHWIGCAGHESPEIDMSTTMASVVDALTVGTNCDAVGTDKCYPMSCIGGPYVWVAATSMYGCKSPAGFTNNPRAQLEYVKFNCPGNNPGTHAPWNFNCIPVAVTTGQEDSWAKHIQVAGLASGGRALWDAKTDSGGAADSNQNNGSFDFWEVVIGPDCNDVTNATNMYGFYIDGSPQISAGIGGKDTFTGSGCAAPPNGQASVIAVQMSGLGSNGANFHIEQWNTGFATGQSRKCLGCTFSAIECVTSVTNCGHIFNTNNVTANINGISWSAVSANPLIKDDQLNLTVTSQSMNNWNTSPANSNANGPLLLRDLVASNQQITISPASGFNTGAVTNSNGTIAFLITIGVGAANNTGTIALPTADNGWSCTLTEITAPATNTPRQSGQTTTSATFTNYNAGVATNWTNSDKLAGSCLAF